MIKKISLIAFLYFFSQPCYAKIKATIGTSINYLNINHPQYKYVDNDLKLSGLNLGAYYVDNSPITFGFQTNRLLNPASNRIVKNQQNTHLRNKTKTIADTFWIGYKINRVVPAIFVTNSKVSQKLYINNKLAGKQVNSAILGGVNLTYFFNQKISGTVAILAPNKELNLETGVVFGINYNFSL